MEDETRGERKTNEEKEVRLMVRMRKRLTGEHRERKVVSFHSHLQT